MPLAVGSLVLVAIPVQAGASVDPQRSIAGVRLGMQAQELREVLGDPAATKPSPLHGGWTQWVYPGRRLRINLTERGDVWDVSTTSRRERTSAGVGVGSRERTLRRRHRVRCRKYGGRSPLRNDLVCVDRLRHDGPFTTYRLRDGRVIRVTVARGLAR